MSPGPRPACLRLACFQHQADGGRQLLPGALLGRELLAAGVGELAVLGAPVVLRLSPAGADPAAPLEAVPRRGQGPLADPQRVAGRLLPPLWDRPPQLG